MKKRKYELVTPKIKTINLKNEKKHIIIEGNNEYFEESNGLNVEEIEIIEIKDTFIREKDVSKFFRVKSVKLENTKIFFKNDEIFSVLINSNIEVLKIENTKFNFEVLEALKQSGSSIKELEFVNNSMKMQNAKTIGEIMNKNQSLETLKIENNNEITTEGVLFIIDSILKNKETKLKTLEIKSNKIKEEILVEKINQMMKNIDECPFKIIYYEKESDKLNNLIEEYNSKIKIQSKAPKITELISVIDLETTSLNEKTCSIIETTI
jgi:Txe/YoeB family toxin of Txe-Axe toxin-antitoxin module